MALMDQQWLIICACFVFFMQAGFICYEVGFVQPKNVISVSIENMIAFVIATLAFFLVGFPIMFGAGEDYIFIFYELMYAGTAVTIFAGSMSERTRLVALLPATALVGALVYPVFGHWVWAGLDGGAPGFLEKLGFLDFAGASVVHSTAGWIALAGILVVGPRRGRWESHRAGSTFGRSNIPFAALGTFILWFSWFGFNGGSLLRFDHQVGLILLNTNLAASAGVAGAVLTVLVAARKSSYMEAVFNGALGGLVAITAGSDMVSPAESLIVGFAAGTVVVLASLLLVRLKIDDAVNAVPIHAAGGICGILLCPLFAAPEFLRHDSRGFQFLIQLLGVGINFLWAFGAGLLIFFIIKKTIGLRVSPEDEEKGLNIVEFSDMYSWLQYQKEEQYETLTQDLYNKIRRQNAALRRQTERLVATQEQEREQVARDLHDGVGQTLAALKLNLGLLRNQAGDEALRDQAERSIGLVDATLGEIRSVLRNLKPVELRNLGLAESLRRLCGKAAEAGGFALDCRIEEPLPKWDETEALNLYRIVQESLANILRHAGATEVRLHFARGEGRNFVLTLSDNGAGFDPEATAPGIGLTALRERAAMLNGTLLLNAVPGAGTVIRLEIPYEEN